MRSQLVMWLGLAACASAPRATAPTDRRDDAAIRDLVVRFERGVASGDEAELNALWLYQEIPFRYREAATGKVVDAGTGAAFAHDVAGANPKWDERMTGLAIGARDGLATLEASYQFLDGGHVTNHGREIWLLAKTETGWKIAAVAWSVTLDP